MENLFLINEWNYRACYKKSSVKTLKLKQLSLMCDNLMWWYDYITMISYSSDLLLMCPCFKSVRNSTNNAQFYIPWNEIEGCPFDMVNITLTEKGKVSTYMVSVSYENQPVNICRFVFFGSREGTLMSQIDVYGKAWRLQSAMNNEFLIDSFVRGLVLWWLNPLDEDDDELADDLTQAFFSYYISRIDFRIDFWSKDKKFYDNIIHPYDLLKNKMSWKSEYYNDEWDRYTSKNVWKKENKYVYVRFYDKKQEINDDNTQFLYSDYYNYEWNIWRLEFQFMSRFTTARNKYNWRDLFIENDLTKQIFEYIGLDLKSGAFSRFYSPQKIPFDKLPIRKKKSIGTRLKNTLNYLSDNNINPLAFIEAVYTNSGEEDRLKDFQNHIVHYIDKKDSIVPQLLELLKWENNIDI